MATQFKGVVMNKHSSLIMELGPDALDALAEFEAAEERLHKLLHAENLSAEQLASARADVGNWAQIFTLRAKACAALAGRYQRY